MNTRLFSPSFGLLAASLLLPAGALRAADTYDIDPVHSGVTFKASHMGVGWIFGRFNTVSGTFTIDSANPAGTSFALTIKADSIDTNNRKRDDHLESPDFFNVKQFPGITFQSTAVKPIDGGYEVTGDFTMHGVTKPLTFILKGGKVVEFPPGAHRTGFVTQLTIKRSDFGIDKFKEMLGDDVPVDISLEATRK